MTCELATCRIDPLLTFLLLGVAAVSGSAQTETRTPGVGDDRWMGGPSNSSGPGGPGTVLSHQKISDSKGGFGGDLDSSAFGGSVASLGDLNGDGIEDLVVGASGDDDGGLNRGAVWILFLDIDGTVKSEQKISSTQGGFGGSLDDGDGFGRSVSSFRDLDGDGVRDLVVGAPSDEDGGPFTGAVWILFLDTDGTVKSEQKINETNGGFGGSLHSGDRFGADVSSLDDVDGDGIDDLAVGAHLDEQGGPGLGAVWILFLDTDGTVKSEQKINDTLGGFEGELDDLDQFGVSVSALGDLDGDGTSDLAVGAWGDDDGGASSGAVWIPFLNTNGRVKSEQKISATEGGFGGGLSETDLFGRAVSSLGDLNGDGIGDLAVGALSDDDGGTERGAVWILFLNSDGTVKSEQKISATEGGFRGALDDGDLFGASLSAAGDLDGDGIRDLAVGAPGDDDGGPFTGATWILFLDGAVRIDFATQDDFETPLVNGQSVSTPAHFSDLFALSTAGPGHFGAAAFDSTRAVRTPPDRIRTSSSDSATS